MQSGSVAVLVGNPALRSILATTLAAAPLLGVRAFDRLPALEAHLRLVPAELIVMDLDLDAARLLRRLPSPRSGRFELIGLAADADAGLPARARAAGIDEVLLKPMSPRYLLERVLSRLARRVAVAPVPIRPMPIAWSQFGDNIVPLFPQPQG